MRHSARVGSVAVLLLAVQPSCAQEVLNNAMRDLGKAQMNIDAILGRSCATCVTPALVNPYAVPPALTNRVPHGSTAVFINVPDASPAVLAGPEPVYVSKSRIAIFNDSNQTLRFALHLGTDKDEDVAVTLAPGQISSFELANARTADARTSDSSVQGHLDAGKLYRLGSKDGKWLFTAL